MCTAKLARFWPRLSRLSRGAISKYAWCRRRLAASIAIEAIRRSKDPSAAGVYKGITSMTGSRAFNPGFTVGPVTFSAKDHIGAESLRLLQADSTGNFKAITGAQRSAIFPLVHPLK